MGGPRRSSPSRYRYRGTYAASRIQRAYRRKKYQKDKIKTEGDVKRAVRNAQPSSVVITNTTSTMSTVPFVYQQLSRLLFSNSNDTLYARKSTNIRVGHISFRVRLTVQDSPGNLVRLMVVRLKDSATPAATFDPQSMFVWNSGQGQQPDNLYSDVNLRIAEVKYDKVFNLQQSTAALPATRMQDIYLNFNTKINETWKYATTDNGTNTFTRNMKDYFLVAFSDSAVGTAHPRIKATSFLWFKNISNNA